MRYRLHDHVVFGQRIFYDEVVAVWGMHPIGNGPPPPMCAMEDVVYDQWLQAWIPSQVTLGMDRDKFQVNWQFSSRRIRR